MINRIILILSVSTVLLSCSRNSESEFQYYPDGRVQREIRFINDSTEVALTYFEAGGLKDSITMINGKISGRNKKYYLNGNLEKDCFWKDGVLNGPCRSYYQSGNLMSVVTYDLNINAGNGYEYFDLPGEKIQYLGNYAKVRGKKWVNYQTWYDSLGKIQKATVRIHEVNGLKVVSLNDSLKITFEMDHLEYPLLRVFVGDYDKEYNLLNKSTLRVFNGKVSTIVAYIKPKQVGQQTARGYIQNFKILQKFADGTYKTEGKDIYWSYDYEVVNK